MLKRNLIIIAIAILCLILTGNAFGQEKNRRARVRKPSGATVSGGIFPSKIKTNQPTTSLSRPQNTNKAQFNPKELSVDKIKRVNSNQTNNNYIGETEKNVTKPQTRRRNRQTNQTKSVAPTKPLVTIPTDYPNLKTKKPGNFTGGSEDGQSMKPKPRSNRQTNQLNALPTTPRPKVRTKKPVKPFSGGTDDGQSI